MSFPLTRKIMKRQNIAFVLTGLVRGGAEIQVLEMIKALQGFGYSFSVFCISNRYSVSLKKAFEAVADVKVLGADAGNPWTIFVAFCKLRKQLMLDAPVIVHCHLVDAICFGGAIRMMGSFESTKFIGTFHGQVELEKIGRLTLPFVCGMDLITVVGPHLREVVINVCPNAPVIHVPNGIDLTSFCAPAQYKSISRRLVAVGRLVKEKNFDLVIKSFSLLDESFTLYIFGQGPERDYLNNLVVEFGLIGRVYFCGEISLSGIVLHDFDILVSCSKSEGFSLTICEALASECRVVAFDFPGLVDLYYDVVSKCSHDVSAMANKISELYSEDDNSWLMARKKGRTVAEMYDISKVAVRWGKIYYDLSR